MSAGNPCPTTSSVCLRAVFSEKRLASNKFILHKLFLKQPDVLQSFLKWNIGKMCCKLLATALDFPCSLSSLGNGLMCRKYLEVHHHAMHRAYFFIIWIFIIPFSLFIWSKQPSIAPSRQENNSRSLSVPTLPFAGLDSGFATDLRDLIRGSLNDGVQVWLLKR